uniref:Tetraspanin n=1 Tax=Latimeria chalumnae TaxID=7897 RepID=H3BFF8_LATCH
RMAISPVVKYILFASCYVFWVASGLMIAVGIYAKVAKEAEAVDSLTADPALILIVVGLLMFGITFVGCFGALRLSKCMLMIFAWTLLIILILQVVAAVLGFLFSSMVLEKAADLMEKAISNYRDDLDLQNLIDFIQKKLKCCGVNGYMDWSHNIYFNCKDRNPSLERCAVPFSCCIQKREEFVLNTMCGYEMQQQPEWKAEQGIYVKGCLDQITTWGQQNLLLIGGISLGLFFLEIIMITLAFILIQQIQFLNLRRTLSAD